ncbi:unnamed protein product [Cylicocyclus nassatus]|uniref:Uncharacterized protein n=1 Tax=Cylicocyclus nassatus TaxID=53992 RepID=A0AA36H0N9_CYLNA|nr:unnamed protein product [Cylicocyclus nassatus]
MGGSSEIIVSLGKNDIARQARQEMENVEFQLKQLLAIDNDEPTTSRRRSSPPPQPRTPSTTPAAPALRKSTLHIPLRL